MTPKPFTDEDLKTVKDNLIRYGIDPGIDVCNYFDYPYEIAALVARLDAAEANMGGHSTNCTDKNCICSKKDREEAWRRAKGDL